MLRVLALITSDMKYMYNSNQAVLTNCYTDDTTLIYNKNIKQITVYLTPTNATYCTAFPRGIEAYLILRDTANPILSAVVDDFDYLTTREIVFLNVADISDETFAVMHIFSYSLITQVDIFIFEEQKSALGSCYNSNSVVVIEDDPNDPTLSYIVITIRSTGLCSQYIVNNGAYNYLTHVYLNILGTKIYLDETLFSDSYSTTNADTTLTKSAVPAVDLQSVRQQAVVYGTLEFTSKYGYVEVTFMHTVGNVVIKGKDFYISQSSISPEDYAVVDSFGLPTFWHPNYVVVGLWNDKFVCRAENHPLFAKYLAEKYDYLGFTQYTVRLTATLGDRQVSIQNTTFKPSWNYSERIFYFKCTQGAQDEQQQCNEFYKLAMQDRASYILDVLFFSGSQFLFVEKINLYEVPSCWSGAVVEKDRRGICVQLLTRDDVKRCNTLLPEGKTVDSVLTFQFMNLSGTQNFGMSENYVYDFISLNRHTARYCVRCEEIKFDLTLTPDYWKKTCAANREKLLDEHMAINVMFDSLDPAYFFESSGLIVVTDRMTRVDYSVVQIVAIVVGILLIVWCVIITIAGIIGIMRTVKQAKKKKAQ